MALDLEDPSELAIAAATAFAASGLEAALYGGLVLAAYGEPRETRDADLAVANVSVEQGKAALDAAGIDTLIAFSGIRFGGLLISRISVMGGGKLNTVDLITPRSSRFAAGVVERAMRGSLDGKELRVVAPEDFILLKVLSTREHDLVDARTVVGAFGERLDRALLDAEVELLAAEVADHDVRGRFASVIG